RPYLQNLTSGSIDDRHSTLSVQREHSTDQTFKDRLRRRLNPGQLLLRSEIRVHRYSCRSRRDAQEREDNEKPDPTCVHLFERFDCRNVALYAGNVEDQEDDQDYGCDRQTGEDDPVSLAEKQNLLVRSDHRFRSECSALAGDPYHMHHDRGRSVGRGLTLRSTSMGPAIRASNCHAGSTLDRAEIETYREAEVRFVLRQATFGQTKFRRTARHSIRGSEEEEILFPNPSTDLMQTDGLIPRRVGHVWARCAAC